MACSRDFWAARLQKKKEQLEQLDAVLEAFALNQGLQSYDFDTGQTRQKVERADLSKLRLWMKELESQIAALDARVNGCGVTRARGNW